MWESLIAILNDEFLRAVGASGPDFNLIVFIFFLAGSWALPFRRASSPLSGSALARFFAVGFDVRPALVIVNGAGASPGGGAAGRAVLLAGRGFLDAGGVSEIGVDGWLLLKDSLILCVLFSVGVGGTAGGGIIAASVEDNIAAEPAGDIWSGVATCCDEVMALDGLADPGPLLDTDGFRLIFSLSFFLSGTSILSLSESQASVSVVLAEGGASGRRQALWPTVSGAVLH